MANRKTFNDFLSKPNIKNDDYVVGFDIPEVGGEKKFKISDLKDFVQEVEINTIQTNGSLPIYDPTQIQNSSSEIPHSPFLNGKIFHIVGNDNISLTLPNLIASHSNKKVQLILVNMTEHKRVEISSVPGGPPLHARGVTNSIGQTASTFLKKKYDNALFYFDGNAWFGHGDLDGATTQNIKNISGNYLFTLEDEDKILHFNHSSDTDGASITLPNPNEMVAGTQFFVHNISDGWVEFKVSSDVTFHARAKFLRRKYDDAVVYTDGVNWFATGDLS